MTSVIHYPLPYQLDQGIQGPLSVPAAMFRRVDVGRGGSADPFSLLVHCQSPGAHAPVHDSPLDVKGPDL